MQPTLQASDERAAVTVPKRRAMNAFKHGARSRSLLLTGEDVREFEALRSDLIRTYRPCTQQELRCVRRIAACQWRVERYVLFGSAFDDKLDALLEDDTGTVARHIDPDPHRWQHRSIDCGRQEERFDRLMHRTERRLLELQHHRRNGFLASGDQLLEAHEMPQPEAVAPGVSAAPLVTNAPVAPEPANPTPQSTGPAAEASAAAAEIPEPSAAPRAGDVQQPEARVPETAEPSPVPESANPASLAGSRAPEGTVTASPEKQSGEWDQRETTAATGIPIQRSLPEVTREPPPVAPPSTQVAEQQLWRWAAGRAGPLRD